MTEHFLPEELAERRNRVRHALTGAGLDALLCFHQETMYYLTGFETFGYCFFQCLVMTTDGDLTLVTRAPDRLQARLTSVIDDVRVWLDRADAEPAAQLPHVLAEYGLRGGYLGVEYGAYGLTAHQGRRLDAALEGFAETVDASELVSRERARKSPSEMAYIRRAAGLADDAFDAVLDAAGPGTWEGDVLAAMQAAVFRGGGDYPANPFILGSGDMALLCRDHSGRRHLAATDQLTVEWAGAYRRYHAPMMRTLLVGAASDAHRRMHAVVEEALMACIATCVPGATAGAVFDAHARVLDAAGYRAHRFNACGYAVGATFAPSWMDWPMLYSGNPVELAEGMALFIHIIVMNAVDGRAMTLGQTVEVTEGGAVTLHRHGTELVAV